MVAVYEAPREVDSLKAPGNTARSQVSKSPSSFRKVKVTPPSVSPLIAA
jgi:hypothetical protein